MRYLFLVALVVLGGCAATEPLDREIAGFSITKPLMADRVGVEIQPGTFRAVGKRGNRIVFDNGKYARSFIGKFEMRGIPAQLLAGFNDAGELEYLVSSTSGGGVVDCQECPQFTREELGL